MVLQLQLLLPVIGPAKSSWCLFVDQTRRQPTWDSAVSQLSLPFSYISLFWSSLGSSPHPPKTHKINHKSLKQNLKSTKIMQKGDQILPFFPFLHFCISSHTIFILSYLTSHNHQTHMFGYVSLVHFFCWEIGVIKCIKFRSRFVFIFFLIMLLNHLIGKVTCKTDFFM